MKLRNKKTGEIGIVESKEIPEHRFIIRSEKTGECYVHNSLAKLNEEWEDYEEPIIIYYIDSQGDICAFSDTEADDWAKEKSIGNYFETKEEAEKAVEKLKAWKRLKDKGFRFTAVFPGSKCIDYYISDDKDIENYVADLKLLFGGEDEH